MGENCKSRQVLVKETYALSPQKIKLDLLFICPLPNKKKIKK
jgi:hypothetical protein